MNKYRINYRLQMMGPPHIMADRLEESSSNGGGYKFVNRNNNNTFDVVALIPKEVVVSIVKVDASGEEA